MINNKKHEYVDPFEPHINDSQTIPALKWEDTYQYLGVKLGRQRKGDMEELAQEMTEKIVSSKLMEGGCAQHLCVNYYLDATIVDQTWATTTDSKIRTITKKGLRLPKQTISTFLHTATHHGGL